MIEPSTTSILSSSSDWSVLHTWISPTDSKYADLDNHLIKPTFPVLQRTDQKLVLDGIVKVLNFIYVKFNFHQNTAKSEDLFWNQLNQNNRQDLRSLLGFLFPFILDPPPDSLTSYDMKSKLKSLNDLYTETWPDKKFKFTNSQYNRCIRYYDGEKTKYVFRPYLEEYFEQSLQLLLMSIESVANKLYVNWVDVIPYRINDFETDALFISTQKKINPETRTNVVHLISGYIDPEPGLSLQDIYNVLTNHLYHEIKNYKWLIYDIMIDSKPKCIIRYLAQKFTLTHLLDKKQWSQITEAEQSVFTQQWGELYRSSNYIETKILNHFYFFFAKYHVNARNLIKTGQLILSNINWDLDEDNEDEDLIRITPETTSDAKDGLSRVPIEEIYLFFYDQIFALRKSWYYYSLFEKDLDYIDTIQTSNNIDIYFTHKNVYNYCKSLAHFDGKFTDFINLPKHWMSLKPEQIVMVTHRILNIPHARHNNNWFNVNNYIRSLYPEIARARRTVTNIFTEVTQLLTQMVRSKLTHIIFESMIYHGVLSDFRPTPTISDQNLIISAIRTDNDKKIIQYQYKQMRQIHFNSTMRELYEKHAYYYVTSTPYGQLKSNTGGKYFDFLLGKQNWTFAYALDWTNQINFYHHYINNRVIYVTGAPGVGKSTQVPKLLMYGQKMIDYNSKGKIVCTQPRIAPTVNNATRIADEMGVSIVTKNKVYDKEVPTENYYLQYKHSKSQHVNKSTDSFLRITTDGTLVQELKNSPFLSRTEKESKVFVTNSNEPVNWMKKIMTGNVYDIVIVDESHEHGSNMDIILTLMRDVVYVNNSVKLVIMSATMDDDEPTYRRYYRSISDNRAYPLNSAIEHMKLDRVNLDRRIHMSAPGKTSKYKIESIFLSKTESDKINEQNYVQAGIDKTIEVVNTTTQGGLLLFLAGVADITKAVAKINKRTPANVFCLGYYGTLTDVQRKFAEDSHTFPETFTLFKEDIDKPLEQITRRVSPRTYNRAILVATNVAEASITLNSLQYVIDTGYVKVNTFDVLEGNTKLITVPISWSSAVQRKGRVGRVASGTVYHLYAQEKIIHNKTAYKIADEDITNILVDLIKSEPNDVSMITSINDINHIPNLECIKEHNAKNAVYECLQNPGVYLDMISKQYMLSEDVDDNKQYYTYYGKISSRSGSKHNYENIMRNFREYCEQNHDDYQFQHSVEFMSRGHTGYDDMKLRDPHTTFYIVHPDENILVRDMYTGYFVSLKDSLSATAAYLYYVLIRNGYTREELDWTFKQIDAGFNVEPKVVDFYAPKCDLMFTIASQNLQTVIIPDSTMSLIDFRIKASRYIAEKFSEYYEDVEKLYTEADYNIKSGLVGRLAELRNLADFTVLMDHNNLNWYAYTLAYDLDLANDVIGMLYLMNTFGDFSSWVVNPKDTDTVMRATNIHKNESGDTYFVWTIWQEIKKIVEELDFLKYTKIDTTIFSQFKKISGEFSRNQKIKFEDFLTLNSLKSAGKLGGSHDFYNYLGVYVPVFDNIIKEKPEVVRIQKFAASKHLNPDLMNKFLVNYLSVLFQLNKALWINEYEITHQLSPDIDTTTPVLDWIRKTFRFNRVSELHGAGLASKDNGWSTILETYLRAFSTNLIVVSKDHYLKISNGSRLDKLMWPGKQSFGEQTFLDKSKRPTFLVYMTTRSATTYQNNQVSYITTPSYLTRVDPNIMMQLNPVFFYTVTNTRIDSDVVAISDLSLLDETVRYLRTKFSVSYVLEFIRHLDNPTITQYVTKLLEHRVETAKS